MREKPLREPYALAEHRHLTPCVPDLRLAIVSTGVGDWRTAGVVRLSSGGFYKGGGLKGLPRWCDRFLSTVSR